MPHLPDVAKVVRHEILVRRRASIAEEEHEVSRVAVEAAEPGQAEEPRRDDDPDVAGAHRPRIPIEPPQTGCGVVQGVAHGSTLAFPPMKHTLLRALNRVRLLGPAYRSYERVRAAQLPRGPEPAAADGLPVPPPHLIVRVAGTPDAAWFLESGRLAATAIRKAVERAGAPMHELGAILDFGCGCGRVLRNWAELDGTDVAGSDLSGAAVEWCRENLPFARFETKELVPPLAFAADSFHLAYALSVFTHLPEAMQLDWMDELARVVRPNGFLLLSTHGERYLERLNDDERDRFERGELVVRWAEVPGTNLCTTFHPASWVRARLVPRGFEEVEFVAEGARGNPYQDLFLLRRAA
jgi:SAM-dependent methyltransferase